MTRISSGNRPSMRTRRIPGILTVAAAISLLVPAHPALGLTPNKSNLWYGGDEGIEVVWRTGKNLAYTDDNPKIDPVMTNHARKMDQALLKIGAHTCWLAPPVPPSARTPRFSLSRRDCGVPPQTVVAAEKPDGVPPRTGSP